MYFIDTHTHLDGEEFRDDIDAVIDRAKAVGVSKVFVPAIDLKSVASVTKLCSSYEGFAYPMLGLHPEEVKSDWKTTLDTMKRYLQNQEKRKNGEAGHPYIAIGEIGLDYYWSREYEKEQLDAFDTQIQWAIEYNLPLMIHCRKGQNEMVRLLNKYKNELPGGVFHCFTGNEKEAEELLQFTNFVLGIGGVLTFKKSHLPEVLPTTVPLDRIVLETDSPYMAPVPMRGTRNESAFVLHVLNKLADIYDVQPQEIAHCTNENVKRVFGI